MLNLKSMFSFTTARLATFEDGLAIQINCTDVLYYKYMYIVYYLIDVHLAEVQHLIKDWTVVPQ